MRHDKTNSNQRGAVMMEYVIVGVLIAAACVIGVVVFSRSLLYGFDMGGKGATADSAKVKKNQELTRQQLDVDSRDAKAYHDSMHTGTMSQP
jgi:Flp pilus assembly pilin Flp